MKKILAITLILILAFSLLTACGDNGGGNSAPPTSTNGGGGNSTNSPAQQNADIIKSSEIITQEDTARILGKDVTVDKLDEMNPMTPGAVHTSYGSTGVTIALSITLYQNAALDLSNSTHKALFDGGGIGSTNGGVRNQYEKGTIVEAIPVEGIGDWAFISGLGKKVSTSIDIGYGDYRIFISTTIIPEGSKLGDETTLALRKEILTEAGKLAIERLEAIIG